MKTVWGGLKGLVKYGVTMKVTETFVSRILAGCRRLQGYKDMTLYILEKGNMNRNWRWVKNTEYLKKVLIRFGKFGKMKTKICGPPEALIFDPGSQLFRNFLLKPHFIEKKLQ